MSHSGTGTAEAGRQRRHQCVRGSRREHWWALRHEEKKKDRLRYIVFHTVWNNQRVMILTFLNSTATVISARVVGNDASATVMAAHSVGHMNRRKRGENSSENGNENGKDLHFDGEEEGQSGGIFIHKSDTVLRNSCDAGR